MKWVLACLLTVMTTTLGCTDGRDDEPWITRYEGSTPWKLTGREQGGRTLILTYLTYVEAGDPARNVRDRLQDIEIEETGRAVTVRLKQIIQVRRETSVQSVPAEVAVRLARPLGNRRLIEARTDKWGRRPLDPDGFGDALIRVAGAGDGVCDQSLWGDR